MSVFWSAVLYACLDTHIRPFRTVWILIIMYRYNFDLFWKIVPVGQVGQDCAEEVVHHLQGPHQAGGLRDTRRHEP